MQKKLISLFVSTFNEEGNIQEVYDRISSAMLPLSSYDYEMVFYDNDSQDGTQMLIRGLCERDARVKAIFNSRNYGIPRSTYNALTALSGDAAISLSGDLQTPPEMIPQFIKYWEEGYPVVFGQKTKSHNSLLDWTMRRLYYRIIRFLSDTPHYDQVTGFGLFDRKVVDTVIKNRDVNTLSRHLIPDLGFKVKLVEYTQDKRKYGRSSFSLFGKFTFGIMSICTTSRKPLSLMTMFGFFSACFSFLVGLLYLIIKLLNWGSFMMGQAPVLIGVFFLGSVQLFCLGLIGEYVGLIIERMRFQNMPLVIEEERINFG
jgi:glycosyltransferase involved in cell wall biosynthesis